MENDVRPTWRLAWGLWWRMLLISLGICVVVGGILFALFWMGCMPLECCFEWLPGL